MANASALDADHLKKLIREIPDFPKKGILFYDITTLLKDKTGFATLIDKLSEHYISQDIDLVLGMEARGFIFAPCTGVPLECGLCSGTQAGQASGSMRTLRLRARVREQHPGDSQGLDPEGAESAHRG